MIRFKKLVVLFISIILFSNTTYAGFGRWVKNIGKRIDNEVHRIGRQIDDHVIQELPGVDRARYLNFLYQLNKEVKDNTEELKLIAKHDYSGLTRRNDWYSYTIPNAYCALNTEGGQKVPYKVFISKRDSDKLLFELQPGGACWNYRTCIEKQVEIKFSSNYGVIQRDDVKFEYKTPTTISSERTTILTSENTSTPFVNHTAVIFPYCNGDVYIGSHTAQYGQNKFLHHGRLNLERAILYLKKLNLIRPSQVQDFVVAGSSAGAIGALLNLPFIDREINSVGYKRLILDSPGLQFGDLFWEKFTPDFKNDIYQALIKLGVNPNFNNGMLSNYLPTIFSNFRKWEFAFIQSNRDLIMSLGFGNIIPEDYEKRSLSPDGVMSKCAQSARCSYWYTDSHAHAFTLNAFGIEKFGFSSLSNNHVPLKEFIKSFYKPVPQGYKFNSFGQLVLNENVINCSSSGLFFNNFSNKSKCKNKW